MKNQLKYILLTASFALASCASNGHHAQKSCSSGCETKKETTVKKGCDTGCKTKKLAKKDCPDCAA